VSVPGKRVIVLGMMSKHPVAGVVWQTVHYMVGLERLGCEVYYVEAHALNPGWFMKTPEDDASAAAAAFIDAVMRRFGLGDRWAFHALHADGHCYGLSEGRLKDLYRTADLIINLHGGTLPQPEHSATGRLVYLETDPVQVQVELAQKIPETVAFLESHCAYFTFGENYGRPDCKLPVSPRFHFRPTRQPVVLDFWREAGAPGAALTTIGNWSQSGRELTFEGETYHWSKAREFLKFIDVPMRTDQPFELALSRCGEANRLHLESRGWKVRDGLSLSRDPDQYRRYIFGSRGEFTVAKDQNIRLRSGWFSDRSATYLAAGRPVITQETGFSNIIPTGAGLFGFSTVEDVLAAVDAVNSDYDRHSRAAREIAREYFSHEIVLGRLLEEAGL